MYKTYPISVLDNGDFGRLTRWVDNLTSQDLSHVDTGSCQTIDDWVDALEAQTDVRVVHSSGTDGKLSFIPRSETEQRKLARAWPKQHQGFGNEPNNPLIDIKETHVISGFYRKGAMGQSRVIQAITRHVYGGDEQMVLVANDGRMSADMLSLGGRIRNAEAKGELGRLQISDKLNARRAAFIEEQKEAPMRRLTFMREIAERLRGQRVVLSGLVAQLYDVALDAQANGISDIFAADSLVMVSGGLKGREMPEGYLDLIKKTFGIPYIKQGYGMSELTTGMPSCPQGNFHIPPFFIPYLLDPQAGTPLPRSGTHIGRLGLIDLNAETYWGGFLSGDKVTLSWGDTPCRCGRKGTYVHSEISRFSKSEGGDDKVTCAGAPEAHDKALAFLTDL
jgi:hypothetical protein